MPLIQVLEVSKAPADPNRRVEWALDTPTDFQLFDGADFEIAGWVVAAEGVDRVEVVQDGTIVRRVPADRARVDVGVKYPDIPSADRSGFRTTLPLREWQEALISILVKLRSGGRLPLGEIRARRAWRESALGDDIPFVSIAVSAEAPSEAVAAAVQYARAQTYLHIEIVLIGNPSSRVAEVAARYQGVRAVEEPKRGLAAAWNTGLRRTRGDYLMFLKATDRLLPDALRMGVSGFREHPESAVVLGHTCEHPNHVSPPGKRSDCVPQATLGLFRRSVFDAVGIFSSAAAAPGAEICGRIMKQFPFYCHHQRVVESAR